MRGKFITLEGLDGVGKTTQAQRLATWLKKDKGITAILTREPGGSALGEQIRQWLLDKNNAIDDTSETLLMITARHQHLNEKIKPALNNGQWVICDRFSDSTFAYQGAGRGVHYDFIKQLNRLVMPNITPNLSFYLRLPPDIVYKSLKNQDRFDSASLDFYKQVAKAYDSLAQANNQRIKIIEGIIAHQRQSVDVIFSSMKDIINQRFF